MSKATCSVGWCSYAAVVRGWCRKHYRRWEAYGDPTVVVKRQADDPEPTEKPCLHCNTSWPATAEYYSIHPDSGNLRNVCRPCLSKQKYKSRDRRGRNEEYRNRRRETADYQMQQKYGISLEEFERRAAAQDGKCLICGRVPNGNYARSRLNVDHDHVTGEIRGLICNQCNLSLGNFNDDPMLLRRAADYLEKRLSPLA